MQNFYDLKRYCVLYVDDEEMALKYFEKAFGREFQVLTARNAADGLKIIEERGDEIGVLLTDQRMPGEKGVQLLERARQLRPRLVRMLITAFADFGVTVDAVNLGNIFRYISKPLQVEDMRNTLRRAMEFYILQQERDDLLQEKLSVLHNILVTDRVTSLGILSAGLDRRLNNPLRAVEAFLELTPGRLRQEAFDLDRLRDPSFWRDFHGLVVKQSERIASLLGEVDASVGTGADSAAPVDAILKEAFSNNGAAFKAQGITLQTEITPPLPALPGAGTFRKLVDLIAQCGLTSLPAGKTMTVSAGSVEGGLQISVRDDGPGFPAESTRAVFDPFFIRTEGPHDFGMNLMGLYFLVHHYGGKITFNHQAQGLDYTIRIPQTPAAPLTGVASGREFVTHVLMNDTLWERLLPHD